MRQSGAAVNWENEIRRAKRANTLAFLVTLILAAAVAAALLLSGASCRFSSEKWKNAPEKRTRIVSDLLRRNNLNGMTLDQVQELLGSGKARALRDGAFLLRYSLGSDPVFVPNGDAELEILFRGGVAESFRIHRK